MHYSRKIYFDQKPLILTDDIDDYIRHQAEATTYSRYEGATVAHIRMAQEQLAKNECSGIVIKESNYDEADSALQSVFTSVIAAGGVVHTPTNKILMIHRRGVWDLPKGKLDEGESISECAVREVIEETGIPDDIDLGEELHRSYHVYSFKGKDVLKTTYWFNMRVSAEWPLQPQAEEDITEAVWMEKDKLPEALHHSWPTIREVLAKTGIK